MPFLPGSRVPYRISLTVVLSLVALQTLAQGEAPATSTFTDDQYDNGEQLYQNSCADCHGAALDNGSAPPLAGTLFQRSWSQQNAGTDDLLFIMSTTMPPGGIGQLSSDQYLDILAFILGSNGVLPGSESLQDNRQYLSRIQMFRGANDLAPRYIAGERNQPQGDGPSTSDLLNAATDTENWLYHTQNYEGTRFSPLDQINVVNASSLRPACIYQLGDAGNFQTGPIVHNGTMYITGAHVTAAIDAATCQQRWRQEWRARDREVWLRNRGVALQDGYVVRGTADGYLVAMDADDGALIWARQIADPWLGETLTMAPLIHNGIIYIGPAGSENAISGWVGAFRLEDGEQLWSFDTVPGATREGGDTWDNPLGIPLGGGAVWTPFSLDVSRNELYVAVTNPAPDLPADLRPGENLYTNSIVALDIRSGQLNWYQQMVPNDDHDWDLTQVSPIVRTSVNNVQRDLISTVGKDGVLRVLDQDSHERLFEQEIAIIQNADEPVTPRGVYACPGPIGGVEWNGPAWHPGEQLLITPAVNVCATFTSDPNPVHVAGRTYMGGTVQLDRDNASGWLTAVSIVDGTVRWQYVSDMPMVGAVTTTAGGLVITGELTGDFIVFDVALGEELYRFNTGGPIGAGVISYGVNNRQYLAVASGNPSGLWPTPNPGSSTVVVFSLP